MADRWDFDFGEYLELLAVFDNTDVAVLNCPTGLKQSP